MESGFLLGYISRLFEDFEDLRFLRYFTELSFSNVFKATAQAQLNALLTG